MKKNIFKIATIISCSFASSAFAASSDVAQDGGLLVWGLIGFATAVIMAQAIPASIMFYSMIKALFSTPENVLERNI